MKFVNFVCFSGTHITYNTHKLRRKCRTGLYIKKHFEEVYKIVKFESVCITNKELLKRASAVSFI